MLRKIAIAALAVAGGLFILNSTRLGSYARTAAHKVKVMANKQVPLEFRIEAAKQEISRLVPDMRDHLGVIAEKTVKVQNLRQEVADLRDNLEHRKVHLASMNDELKKGNQMVSLSGHLFPAERVHQLVSRQLESCKNVAQELKAKEALLEAKERELRAEEQQMANIKIVKEQMEVEVAQMETELQTLRLAQQTQPSFTFDDSRLARIKETLNEIHNQLKVEEKTKDLVTSFDKNNIDGIEIQKLKTRAEVSKEVDDFLNDGEAKVAEMPQAKK